MEQEEIKGISHLPSFFSQILNKPFKQPDSLFPSVPKTGDDGEKNCCESKELKEKRRKHNNLTI